MAKNAVDQDLSSAYKRHGGPLKAWKHFGKSRGKKLKDKGKDMIEHFTSKIAGMKEGAAAATKGAVKGSSAGGTSKAIRGRMNEARMDKMTKTAPLANFKKTMPNRAPGRMPKKPVLKTSVMDKLRMARKSK